MFNRSYEIGTPGGSPPNYPYSIYNPEFEKSSKFTHGTENEHVYGPQNIPVNFENDTQNFPIQQNVYSNDVLDNERFFENPKKVFDILKYPKVIMEKFDLTNSDTQYFKLFCIFLIIYIVNLRFKKYILKIPEVYVILFILFIFFLFFYV